MFNGIFEGQKDKFIEIATKSESEKKTGKEDIGEQFEKAVEDADFDIKTGMNLLILENSAECLEKVKEVYDELSDKNTELLFFYGNSSLPIAYEREKSDFVKGTLRKYIVDSYEDIIRVRLKGKEPLQETPGIVYKMVSVFARHNISILSIMGSFDELVLFTKSEDFHNLTEMIREVKE